MIRAIFVFVAVTVLVVMAGACSEGESGLCVRDRECPSGQRCADGICSPLLGGDDSIAPKPDVAPSPDAGLDSLVVPDGAGSDADGGPHCKTDNDGVIARGEMPVKVGASVTYEVGSGLTVDLSKTRWVLTEGASDDRTVKSDLLPVFDWTRSKFPGATYASLLDAGLGTYGVFTVTNAELQLDAVVSKKPNDTRLTYSKPISLLRFPIGPNQSYKTSAGVTGFLGFTPVWLNETYEVSHLGGGTLVLPRLELKAQLVRIEVTQYPLANPLLVTRRTMFLFISECYGIVARVHASGHPSDMSAIKADERWRIGF